MTSRAAYGLRQDVLWGLGLGALATVVALLPGWEWKLAAVLGLVSVPIALWVVAAPLRWVLLFIAVAWLCPPIPIQLGNSGPHMAILIAAAGILAGFVRLGDWNFRPDWLSTSLLVFFTAMALSLASAFAYSGITIALGSVARLCLFAIAVYAFVYARYSPVRLEGSEARVTRCILYCAVLSAALACVDFYYQFPAPAGYGPQFIWLESGVFRRAQGMFYEASTLGNMCAFVLEMIVVALVLRPKALGLPAIPLAISAVPLGLALVLSYSRGSMINLAVAVIVLLWLMRARIRLLRTAVIVIAVVGIASALLTRLFPTFLNAYLLRLGSSLEYFSEAPNAVLSGRLQTWTHLASYIGEHPVQTIFGIGYKTLPYSTVTGTTAIADNTYLSVLIETGIAGLIALCALNVAILAACYRAFKSADGTRSFLGAWFLCFWCGQMIQMLSADLLTYWRLLPAYFCVLALATRRDAAAA